MAGDLVDALRRLEYRGYDSAGVATVENGHLDRRRAEGKLKNLELRLSNEPLQGRTGIGHTRWATHGKPVERNAHPHMNERVAVVHNGIIENFQELRDELTGKGHVFQTETDTETVLHLVSDYLDQGLTPVEAAKAALQRLHGAFALAIIFAGEDNLMIGARQGPPLAIGHGDGRDVPGLRRHRACALHRHHHLPGGRRLRGADAASRRRDLRSRRPQRRAPAIKSVASSLLVDKGNYRHFMAKEIHEQPEVIGHTLAQLSSISPTGRVALPELGLDPAEREQHRRSRPAAPPTMPGSSASTGSSAMRAFPSRSTSPPSSAIASRRCAKGGLSLFITQSGETADTLATLRYCKAQGQRIASIVNVRTSTIAREVRRRAADACRPRDRRRLHQGLHLPAERCWPAWRSRSAARAAPSAPAQEKELVHALAEVPRHISTLLHNEAHVRARSRTSSSKARDVLYLGRGISYPDRARRRAEAQGDLLHPRRGLCGGRAQARPHRPDRRERAGDRRGAATTSCSRRPSPTCRKWRRAAARSFY